MSGNDLIIEVDENNNFLGLRPRQDFWSGGYIHRGVHLLLANSKNEVAIMKRPPTKRWFPNVYTYAVSGTVDNETNAECIKRETMEEIGLSLEPKELFTFKNFSEQDKSFATLFFAKSDDTITPDPYEITEVKWVTLEWLKSDVNKNPQNYDNAILEGMKIYWNKYETGFPI